MGLRVKVLVSPTHMMTTAQIKVRDALVAMIEHHNKAYEDTIKNFTSDPDVSHELNVRRRERTLNFHMDVAAEIRAMLEKLELINK